MTEGTQQPNGASLAGRTAVVTGASSDIGLSAANLFFDSGSRVHAVARRKEAMVEGAGVAQTDSGNFVPHALDVSDKEAVGRAVAEIGDRDGIDILVLAAGTNVPGRRLGQLTPQAWDELLAVNLSGAFYFVHAALPYLRASQGLVILIGSVSGMWPDPSGAAYQASKMGLLGLARAAGFEEHQNGVRVSAILPGIVNTPILDDRPSPPDERTREASLDPEDVARACLFLAALPPRAYVPELTILPTRLQALGKTSTASPPLPEESGDPEGGSEQ